MEVEKPSVQVDLDVGLDEGECPLSQYPSTTRLIHREIYDDVCHLLLLTHDVEDGQEESLNEEDMEVLHIRSPACKCKTFLELGFLPRIIDIRGDSLVIRTCTSERGKLRELFDQLQEIAPVDVLRIRPIDAPDCMTMLDLTPLTEKERKAIERAVTSGYYGSPRRTSLGELASEFGVSKQALSRRLNNAESKLITQLF